MQRKNKEESYTSSTSTVNNRRGWMARSGPNQQQQHSPTPGNNQHSHTKSKRALLANTSSAALGAGGGGGTNEGTSNDYLCELPDWENPLAHQQTSDIVNSFAAGGGGSTSSKPSWSVSPTRSRSSRSRAVVQNRSSENLHRVGGAAGGALLQSSSHQQPSHSYPAIGLPPQQQPSLLATTTGTAPRAQLPPKPPMAGKDNLENMIVTFDNSYSTLEEEITICDFGEFTDNDTKRIPKEATNAYSESRLMTQPQFLDSSTNRSRHTGNTYPTNHKNYASSCYNMNTTTHDDDEGEVDYQRRLHQYQQQNHYPPQSQNQQQQHYAYDGWNNNNDNHDHDALAAERIQEEEMIRYAMEMSLAESSASSRRPAPSVSSASSRLIAAPPPPAILTSSSAALVSPASSRPPMDSTITMATLNHHSYHHRPSNDDEEEQMVQMALAISRAEYAANTVTLQGRALGERGTRGPLPRNSSNSNLQQGVKSSPATTRPFIQTDSRTGGQFVWKRGPNNRFIKVPVNADGEEISTNVSDTSAVVSNPGPGYSNPGSSVVQIASGLNGASEGQESLRSVRNQSYQYKTIPDDVGHHLRPDNDLPQREPRIQYRQQKPQEEQQQIQDRCAEQSFSNERIRPCIQSHEYAAQSARRVSSFEPILNSRQHYRDDSLEQEESNLIPRRHTTGTTSHQQQQSQPTFVWKKGPNNRYYKCPVEDSDEITTDESKKLQRLEEDMLKEAMERSVLES